MSKLNYRIHTNSIEDNSLPPELKSAQIAYAYANEAKRANGTTSAVSSTAVTDIGKGGSREFTENRTGFGFAIR